MPLKRRRPDVPLQRDASGNLETVSLGEPEKQTRSKTQQKSLFISYPRDQSFIISLSMVNIIYSSPFYPLFGEKMEEKILVFSILLFLFSFLFSHG